MTRTLPRSSWAPVAGALLVLAGAWLVEAARRSGTTGFGWFAYAPLSSEPQYADYLPPGPWPGLLLWGLGLTGAGLLVLGLGVGYLLGSRARPRPVD